MSKEQLPKPLILWLETRGAQAALARELGITEQAINNWTRVPAERCREVERVTGIPRHALRPDIYGDEPRARGNGMAASAAV